MGTRVQLYFRDVWHSLFCVVLFRWIRRFPDYRDSIVLCRHDRCDCCILVRARRLTDIVRRLGMGNVHQIAPIGRRGKKSPATSVRAVDMIPKLECRPLVEYRSVSYHRFIPPSLAKSSVPHVDINRHSSSSDSQTLRCRMGRTRDIAYALCLQL